jgi:hypothetical protein
MRWCLSLILTLLLSACGNPLAAAPTPTCLEQSGSALSQLQGVAREWDDAYKLANQTPRAALSAQIGALQTIKRKAEDVTVPDCLSSAKSALIQGMDLSIEGFLAFLGQKPQTEVNAVFARANDRIKAYTEAMGRLAQPVPTP